MRKIITLLIAIAILPQAAKAQRSFLTSTENQIVNQLETYNRAKKVDSLFFLIKELEKYPPNEYLEFYSLFFKASAFTHQNKLDSTSYYTKLAKGKPVTQKNKKLQVTMSNFEAYVSFLNKQYHISFDHAQNALQASKESNDTCGMASAYMNMARSYEQMNKVNDSAKSFINEAIVMAKTGHCLYTYYVSHFYAANICYGYKEYAQAGVFADTALSYFKQVNNNRIVNLIYLLKLDLVLAQKNYSECERLYPQYLSYGLSNKDYDFLQALYPTLIAYKKDLKDYKAALDFSETFRQLTDSIMSKENVEELANAEVNYQKKLKEQENVLLQSENKEKTNTVFQLRLLYAFSLLGFIVAAFAIYKWRSQKQRQQETLLKETLIQEQLKTLQLELSPHFLQNIFSNLQTQTTLEYDESKVKNYISQMASFFRNVLNTASTQVQPLENELDFIDSYINMQKSICTGYIEVEYDIDPGIDYKKAMVPCFLLQPLIENTIRHGFKKGTLDGKIAIKTEKMTGDIIRITVTDNGVGLNQSFAAESHAHIGIKNLKQRLSLFKKNATLSLQKNNPKGAVAEICI
jgi:two-component sensor histidine kinase